MTYFLDVHDKAKPKSEPDKRKRINNYESVNALYQGWELTPNAFISGIFTIRPIQGKGRPLDLARVANVDRK